MPIEDSPTLEKFTEGKPPRPALYLPPKKRLWVVIAVLFLLVLLLLAGNLLKNRSATATSGSGVVTGMVVDDNNLPIQAGALILNSKIITTSAIDGSFSLQAVPQGPQVLVITFQGGAREFPITVVDKETLDMGTIKMAATAEP